ncbi:unnamed protein product [Heterotrigona itama]|uniref:Aquaporin n=1 Tax=Heterotrigona itama TaxID=395501 RepID=A0A6V7GX21_9HYME|nr:unnamed protein product [Heterotrigona itama]
MFLAEVVGTGILLFVGCMGSIGTMGRILPPPLQASMAFGMTVNLLIMMLGHVSGAHLNPAVTIGAVILKIKSIPTGIVYVVGQFIGATIGYGLLMVRIFDFITYSLYKFKLAITPPELFNDGSSNSSVGHCVTTVHPGISTTQAVLVEILCTSFILCAASATWDPRCAHTTDSTAIRFGFSVVAVSLAAIYWFGPTVGAVLGTYTYVLLFAEKKPDLQNDRLQFLELKPINASLKDFNCKEERNINGRNLELMAAEEAA